MPKTRYQYNIMLRPEPEGGFTAIVPALPGCVSYGRTLPEARMMAKDAISGYIKSLRKHREPVPAHLANCFRISFPNFCVSPKNF
jgi:antitoxin HicB